MCTVPNQLFMLKPGMILSRFGRAEASSWKNSMPKINGSARMMMRMQMTSKNMMPPGGGDAVQPLVPSSNVLHLQVVPPATILLGVARHSFFFLYVSQRPSDGKKMPARRC